MQREVTRLLDELAPEKATPRTAKPVAPIQRHRTPNGCILQADTAALSVTWYAEAEDQDRVGELQIMLWQGVVSRRGAAQSRTPATLIRQEVLNPIEQPADESVWRSTDGTLFSTAGLVAHCVELLDQQIQKAG